MVSHTTELAQQQSFFATVRRREGKPYNPPVDEQYAKNAAVQIDSSYHFRELSRDDDDMDGWARPAAPCQNKQSVASSSRKRKWEHPADFDLELSHTFKRMRGPRAKAPVLKRPAAGEPITHIMAVPSETSLTPSLSQQQSDIEAYKASLQAVQTSKNPRKAAMQILEQSTSNLAGTTLVAALDGAATPTFKDGDFPAYINRRSRQNSSHPLFTPRDSTPETPTWESIEPDTLGARWAIEPHTGRRYLKIANHGPAEQMAPVSSLRTHSLDASCSPSSPLRETRQPLPPTVPSTPSQQHERVYGLPLLHPNTHWYKDLGARSCNAESHNGTLCGKTHVEYTKVTLKEAKTQAQAQRKRKRKRKAELRLKPAEDEMVARNLTEVQKGGGRVRRQTKRAIGE